MYGAASLNCIDPPSWPIYSRDPYNTSRFDVSLVFTPILLYKFKKVWLNWGLLWYTIVLGLLWYTLIIEKIFVMTSNFRLAKLTWKCLHFYDKKIIMFFLIENFWFYMRHFWIIIFIVSWTWINIVKYLKYLSQFFSRKIFELNVSR